MTDNDVVQVWVDHGASFDLDGDALTARYGGVLVTLPLPADTDAPDFIATQIAALFAKFDDNLTTEVQRQRALILARADVYAAALEWRQQKCVSETRQNVRLRNAVDRLLHLTADTP